jgi:large repetitive protein
MKNVSKLMAILAFCGTILYSCDITRQDAAPAATQTEQTTFLTTPGSNVVMNVLELPGYEKSTSFKVKKQPANGSATFLKEGILLYTPTQKVKIDYFILEGEARQDTIRIKFVPVDSLPCQTVTQPDKYIAKPGESITLNVLANDVFCSSAADTTSLQIASPPQQGTALVQGSRLVYQSKPGYTGVDFLIYKICDAKGVCSLVQVGISVDDGTAPCNGVQDDNYVINDSLTLFVLSNDQICGQTLDPASLTILTPPQHGTVKKSNSGAVYYITAPGYTGADMFTYQVCAKNAPGTCGTAQVKLQVLSPPSCVTLLRPDSFTYSTGTAGDTAYVKGARIYNLANDDICYNPANKVAITKQPQQGTVSVDPGGYLLYIPKAGFKGNDQLEYTICNSPGQCEARATVTIKIE